MQELAVQQGQDQHWLNVPSRYKVTPSPEDDNLIL